MLVEGMDGAGLRVVGSAAAVLAEAPKAAVQATSRLGALRRRLRFPDGGCFETADNDAIDAMLRGGSGFLHRLESSWRIVLVSVAAAALAAAWFGFYGAPLTAALLARHTPAAITRFMTQQTLDSLDGRILLPTRLSTADQLRYQRRFDAIAAGQAAPASRYHLLPRNAPLVGPNAFALPDGDIVMTDQLAALVRNDAEIDGVFAHEMSHVNHAHALQRVYQASLVPAVIAFMTGDASQVGHFAAILPGILLQSAYSRQFEQQADDDAAALLRRRGENPGHLADLLERITQKICHADDCGPSWLGSHPATAARAARLRRAPAP